MVSGVVEAGQLLAEQISEFSSSGLRGDQSEGKELLMLWVTGPSYQEAKHVCICEGGEVREELGTVYQETLHTTW